VDNLQAQNLAYPCFCSEAELERDRQQAAANNLPPRYSGRCAKLSSQERAERLERGENHAIRFRLPEKPEIGFTDLIKGQVTVPAGAFGDFVLLRSNGWPSYNLAVVVDDADMGINLVLRGEDHLTNTARQILLYEAMKLTAPSFAHHGLLVDTDGKKLSKRTGALSQWQWSIIWPPSPAHCPPKTFSLPLKKWHGPSTPLRWAGATRS
jgi:glutamyl-tRNA synthetase/nondiscriminating glutamyl-tRNA synthetase